MTRYVLYFAGLAALALWGNSCRLPPPTTTIGKVISCSTEAVQKNGPALIAPVNTCLAGVTPVACLLGLINPAAGVTEDIIACVTRKAGGDFAAAASGNPSDTRSSRSADSARDFLMAQKYTFKD